ncbi:hypothetical protein B5F78_11650 [Bacteroides sp. An279]|nr:hypothetical protein B5F78_11650 [Bacteroides sp. An279]
MYAPSPTLTPGSMDIEARLLQIPNRQLLHHGTCTDEILFQMNFRRSQIIFPCANLWNSIHFFPKVSVDDSQIPA